MYLYSQLMRGSDNGARNHALKLLAEDASKASWPTQNLRPLDALATREVRMPSGGQRMTSESSRFASLYVSNPWSREVAKSYDCRTGCERDNEVTLLLVIEECASRQHLKPSLGKIWMIGECAPAALS
jgi:hypothetical protein